MKLIEWIKSLFNKPKPEEEKEENIDTESDKADKINQYYVNIFRPWFNIFKKEIAPRAVRDNKYIAFVLFNIYYHNAKIMDTPDLDCDKMRFASNKYMDYLICDAINMKHGEEKSQIVKSVNDICLFAEFLEFANKMMLYKNNGDDSDIYSEYKRDTVWVKVIKEDYRLAYIFTIEKKKDKNSLEAFLDDDDNEEYDYFENFYIRRDYGNKEETKFRLINGHIRDEEYPDVLLYNRMEEEFFNSCSRLFQDILLNSTFKYTKYVINPKEIISKENL